LFGRALLAPSKTVVSFGQSFTDLKTLKKNAAADHGAIAMVVCGRMVAARCGRSFTRYVGCVADRMDRVHPSSLCDGAPSSVAAEDMFV
jgi:hypothetical protein